MYCVLQNKFICNSTSVIMHNQMHSKLLCLDWMLSRAKPLVRMKPKASTYLSRMHNLSTCYRHFNYNDGPSVIKSPSKEVWNKLNIARHSWVLDIFTLDSVSNAKKSLSEFLPCNIHYMLKCWIDVIFIISTKPLNNAYPIWLILLAQMVSKMLNYF